MIVWTLSICVQNDLIITQTSGTDIGYDCTHDSECRSGNGGKYSECNQHFHKCVCTINAMGNEELYSTDCNGKALTEAGYCSKDCFDRELRKWENGEDWYGNIPAPFTTLYIEDKQTPVCFDPNRADNSVPAGFVIKNSSIPGAGRGVFTTQFIRRGTLVGPYKGYIEPNSEIAVESGYSWKVVADSVRPEPTWIDGKDISYSNWLRYINMPTNADTENLVVLQHQGEMYYAAFKSIPAGTELLLHYGTEYAEVLNIDYIRPDYYYAHEDYVGGACYSGEGTDCLYDTNAVCIDETCLCKPGSHARYGACITDGTLGGRCFTKDGERCTNDENAICRRGVCVCNDNANAVNTICVLDETFGGRCSGKNGEDCKVDNNAECVDGICDCKYATAAIFGKCMKDEMVGGKCAAHNSDSCKKDKNAECVNGLCTCVHGTLQMGQFCIRVESFGELCFGLTGTECENDINAVCVDGVCQCREGSSAMDGYCMQDEKLGGKCLGAYDWPCKLEKQAVCRNGRCECRAGSSEAEGSCVSDGTLNGLCKRGECKGKGVVCNTVFNKCVCRRRLVNSVGRCVKQ